MCSSRDSISSMEQEEQNFTVFAALKSCLDGQLADVRTEWRTKTTSVSCRRGPRKCWNNDKMWDGFGSEHTAKPRKVEYCTSELPRRSLSIQRQLDNIDVIIVSDLTEAQRETHKFPFSWRNEYHWLYLWSSEDNMFWNCFIRRKVRWKVLHSAWADTSAAWTEPSL